jgi:hypothetical protein
MESMIKIAGLVSAFNQVRTQLQAGIPAERQPDFRRQVREIVRQVEAICAGHGHPSRVLPGPSRQAYQFLKSLDLDHLPLPDAATPVAPGSPVRVKNVVAISEDTARQVWMNRVELHDSSTAREALLAKLAGHVRQIEEICRTDGQTPAALESRSRLAFTYLSFISNEENLWRLLAALRMGGELVGPGTPPLQIHLLGMNSLWRFRAYSNVRLLKVNLGFINADRPVWQALLNSITRQADAATRRIVSEFTLTEEFSDLLFEVESLAAPPAPLTRGRVHDLDESFQRVNQIYFGGQMARPTIGWNQTPTFNKFGHYQPARDSVMISVSLDSPEVSSTLLDYVMYHELLHKKHGSILVNGRRIAHSPAFRNDERQFIGMKKAEEELTRLARRQAKGWR